MGLRAADAAKNAGRWLTVPHTSPAFATVAADVRLSSTLSELRLKPAPTSASSTSFAGVRATALRNSSGETVYVQASGARLPLGEVGVHGKTRVSVTFSRWNEPLRIVAPTRPTTA
jgi:hypothetical protein